MSINGSLWKTMQNTSAC